MGLGVQCRTQAVALLKACQHGGLGPLAAGRETMHARVGKLAAGPLAMPMHGEV